MARDRLIQLVALVVLVAGATVCGAVLPRVNDIVERHRLRYTNEAVEGAPPIVALGTAIGALRGLIVDILWIKVHLMKQEGQYYEIMADADLITKLQPRFAAVWAFHGHNMAYNISVVHNTEPERWEWVNAGINLVRNKGLRYNPNDLQLHRELAFWFMHKIEGVSDDAHLYYKREFAREWHYLLGEPPQEYEARIAWIKEIADAPKTLEDAERRTPGVAALVARLTEEMAPYKDRFAFGLDQTLLQAWAEREAMGRTVYGRALRIEQVARSDNPAFVAFDEIASDPEYAGAWKTLLAFVRRRILLDEYNMDPRLMYEFTRDYGPIDWRSGYAHSLYWSLKASEEGEERVAASEEDVYRIVNNDRIKLQSMQGLARWGRISFDPFSSEWVSRLPDPRWIDVIDRYWEAYSLKHRDTRGPGPDLFLAFHKNFLTSSVRELYRSGERALAQKYLDRLNNLYGTGNRLRPDPLYSVDLDTFVWSTIRGEYDDQPHLAPSEVAASLRYGFRVGLGENRPEVLKQTLAFSRAVTEYFKTNEYNNFVDKMGSARLGDLIGQLEQSVPMVFAEVMVDGTIPLEERLIQIWGRAPVELQLPVYDRIRPHIERQLGGSMLGAMATLDQALPPPPGIEEYRIMQRQAAEKREAQKRPGMSDVERR